MYDRAKRLYRRFVPKFIRLGIRNAFLALRVFRARLEHRFVLFKVRSKIRNGKPIKVLFIDSELAKWKTQTLFKMMAADPNYEPIVGVSHRDHSCAKTTEEIRAEINDARMFFERINNKTIAIYDPDKKTPIDFSSAGFDLIFYQQPWYEEGCHNIEHLNKCSLGCYVPYFLPIYDDVSFDGQMPFHRYLAYFFLPNNAWVSEYKKGVGKFFFSGKLLGLGHTMLDGLADWHSMPSRQTIIYAPHFSISKSSDKFKPITATSTFLENGIEILQYAKKHPEINWIFKPHPGLRTSLIDADAWTEDQVNAYYGEWASIGEVNNVGEYLPLFEKATSMITDCNSFLLEFGATGKPIIHLISTRNTRKPAKPALRIWASFYEAHNLSEMFYWFKEIFEKGNDPNREERLAAIEEANYIGVNAAKNIMDFFEREFLIEHKTY